MCSCSAAFYAAGEAGLYNLCNNSWVFVGNLLTQGKCSIYFLFFFRLGAEAGTITDSWLIVVHSKHLLSRLYGILIIFTLVIFNDSFNSFSAFFHHICEQTCGAVGCHIRWLWSIFRVKGLFSRAHCGANEEVDVGYSHPHCMQESWDSDWWPCNLAFFNIFTTIPHIMAHRIDLKGWESTLMIACQLNIWSKALS